MSSKHRLCEEEMSDNRGIYVRPGTVQTFGDNPLLNPAQLGATSRGGRGPSPSRPLPTVCQPQRPGDPRNRPHPQPDEAASSTQQTETPVDVIFIRFDEKYLYSAPGILRIFQLVFALTALVCVTESVSWATGGYLLLPLSWHLRVFVFVAVVGFLLSLMLFGLNVTWVIDSMPLNWNLVDMILSGVCAFLFLFCSSLVATSVDFYQNHSEVPWTTLKRLITASVFGYGCFFLFSASTYISYREWKGFGQFSPKRFISQNALPCEPTVQCNMHPPT